MKSNILIEKETADLIKRTVPMIIKITGTALLILDFS